jgi:hypothetical protein
MLTVDGEMARDMRPSAEAVHLPVDTVFTCITSVSYRELAYSFCPALSKRTVRIPV